MATTKSLENHTTFPERLKLAIGPKSSRSFALECGVSPTVMHQYLSGKSEPSRLVLISIAKTSGVNLEWLLTGEGEMRQGGQPIATSAKSVINKILIERIIEALFSLENLDETPPTPKMQAEHLVFFYDLLNTYYNAKEMTVENIMKFISAFSSLSEIVVEHGFADQPDSIELMLRAIFEGGLYPGISAKRS